MIEKANNQTIELSKILIWSFDLIELKHLHSLLEEDIETLLRDGYTNKLAFGDQTLTKLHELQGDHWDEFFFEIRKVVNKIVQESKTPLDEGNIYLRAWALKLSKEQNYNISDAQLKVIHNHCPAFLSAVYYLKIPENIESHDAGTFFLNPHPHPLVSPNPGVIIPAIEGRLVLFPSWLLHGPAQIDKSYFKSARIVIAIDVHYVPK